MRGPKVLVRIVGIFLQELSARFEQDASGGTPFSVLRFLRHGRATFRRGFSTFRAVFRDPVCETASEAVRYEREAEVRLGCLTAVGVFYGEGRLIWGGKIDAFRVAGFAPGKSEDFHGLCGQWDYMLVVRLSSGSTGMVRVSSSQSTSSPNKPVVASPLRSSVKAMKRRAVFRCPPGNPSP